MKNIWIFHPSKTVNKNKSRICQKQGIKNFLFLYYIQPKCVDITDKNPNVADDELSIKDGLILVFGDTLTPIQKAISSNFKFTSRTQINLNFVSRQTFFETPLSKLF